MGEAEAVSSTANDRFKRRAETWFWKSLILVVGVHFAAFAYWPGMKVAEAREEAEDTRLVELTPDVPLPPAPPEVARPALPVISLDAPIDQVIPPTTFEAYAPEPVPPRPEGRAAAVEEFRVWSPSMVRPRLRNAEEVERALRRAYPLALRQAGIGGTVHLQLWVDEVGAVVRAAVARSSGVLALDSAALGVVELMRMAPASSHGRAVRVRVEMPLSFRVR